MECWQAALCLAQQLQEPEGDLQSQLRVARIRELLTEAGLSSYRHLAEEEGTSIIATLYSELPLQGDRPGQSLYGLASSRSEPLSAHLLPLQLFSHTKWHSP